MLSTTSRALILRAKVATPNPLPLVPARALSAKAEAAAAASNEGKKKKRASKPAVHSKSFVQNIFRGMVEPEQTFPYPQGMSYICFFRRDF